MREKLSWIIMVLSLQTISFITSTIGVVLTYSIYDKSVVGYLIYLLIGVTMVISDWTFLSSFVIFALEYYQASSLISMAKEGKSQL